MKDFDYLKSKLGPVFQAYGVRRVVLFGSWAKDMVTEKSDIDFCVDSGLKGMKFVGLVEDTRRALGDKEVDMLDVTHIEPGSLIEDEIKKTGILLYEG